jgi:hypothetical protein
VGKAENQCEGGQTTAKVIDLLRQRWFGDKATDCNQYFDHCEREMDKWVAFDDVLGGTIENGNLRGFPKDLNVRKERAGMSTDDDIPYEDDARADKYYTGNDFEDQILREEEVNKLLRWWKCPLAPLVLCTLILFHHMTRWTLTLITRMKRKKSCERRRKGN